MMLPRLFERMQTEAPGASLAIVAPSPSLGEKLLTGEVHLAMIPPIAAPGGVEALLLPDRDDARWVVVGRHDRPALQDGRMDLDTYCNLPHVMMSVTGRGGSWVDALLAEQGRERRIALRLPYGLAVPAPLVTSDAVVTVPEWAFRHFEKLWPLRAADAPFDGPPPSAMLLGSLGLCFVGWLRKRKAI